MQKINTSREKYRKNFGRHSDVFCCFDFFIQHPPEMQETFSENVMASIVKSNREIRHYRTGLEYRNRYLYYILGTDGFLSTMLVTRADTLLMYSLSRESFRIFRKTTTNLRVLTNKNNKEYNNSKVNQTLVGVEHSPVNVGKHSRRERKKHWRLLEAARSSPIIISSTVPVPVPVSYTHLTLPTKA